MIQLSLACINHPDLLPLYNYGMGIWHCLDRPSMLPICEHEAQVQFSLSKSLKCIIIMLPLYGHVASLHCLNCTVLVPVLGTWIDLHCLNGAGLVLAVGMWLDNLI